MMNAVENERSLPVEAFDGLLTRRVFAFVVDYLLIGMLMIPAAVVLFFLSVLTLGLGFYLYPILFFVVAGLYFGLSLSSSAQATPGMRIMDLVMLRDDGYRLDFWTALLHVVVFWVLNSVLTPLILLVGLFTNRRRLLHDIALGTVTARASRLFRAAY